MKVQIPADEWAALCEAPDVTDNETPLQAAQRLRGELAEAKAHLYPRALVGFDEARDVPERVFETDPPPKPVGEAVSLEHVGGDEYRGRFTQPLRFHEGERVRVAHPTAVRVTNEEGE